MAIFELIDGLDEEQDEQDDNSDVCQSDCYHMSVNNPALFGLCIDYISIRSSCRQVSKTIQMTKSRTGLASLGQASEGKVTNYVRIACVYSIENVSTSACTLYIHRHRILLRFV